MKKITIALVIVMLLVFLAACGPDYTEEYNAVVDKYNADVAKYDTAVEAFDVILDDLSDEAVFVAEIEKLKAVDEEVLSNTKQYLDEIKGYEEGVDDKESYQMTVSNMEDTIDALESELAGIPQLQEYTKLAFEFANLSTEWEATFTAKSDELSGAEDADAINATLDELIAIDNDLIGKVEALITQVKAIENEEIASDLLGTIADMEDAIATIEGVNNDLEDLKQ